MKSVAFIITRQDISELIEDDIFIPIIRGEATIKAIAFYFVGEGVYHLIKGSRHSKNIKAIIELKETAILASESSIRSRKLQNVLIEGLQMGTLKDFYQQAAEADHIISF